MAKTRYALFCESWFIALLVFAVGTLLMIQYLIMTHNIKSRDDVVHIETTANENHGKPADFTAPLYRKTLDSTYYAPIKADAIYRNYPFLVMGLFSEEANITINPKLDGNALESDAYLMLKMKNGTLSQEDIDYAERLLQTDITSTVKKQLIAQWYLNDHNVETASTYLKQIKSQYCDSECVTLKQQIGPIQSMIYVLYPAYNVIGKKFEIDVSSSQYFCLLFMLAVSFLLLIVLSLRKYSTRVIRL